MFDWWVVGRLPPLRIALLDRDDARVPGEEIVYQAVVARRLQWDNLVWQVPVLSLTAQAFLFTIALGPDSTAVARCIAASLSLVITALSIMLMARHRQAELMDSHWLEAYDAAHFPELTDPPHGLAFRAARNTESLDVGRLTPWIPLRPMFKTWVLGLSLFGVAAIAVFPLAIPGVL